MNPAESVKVRVSQQYKASPERVFDAWLDPEMIGRWMFGPALREEEIVHLSVDGRVGGSFSFLVRRQGQEIDHVGQYLELDRPRRLVLTWGIAQQGTPGDSSRVTIDISLNESGCELILIHELHPDWADYAGRTEVAWSKMLATLNQALSEAT